REPRNRHQRQHPEEKIKRLRVKIFIRREALEMMLNKKLIDKLVTVTQVHRNVPRRRDETCDDRSPESTKQQCAAWHFPSEQMIKPDYREREYNSDQTFRE